MSTQQEPVARTLRISADEVKARLLSGVPITILDARNNKAWATSPVKIQGGHSPPAGRLAPRPVLAEGTANRRVLNLTQRTEQRPCGARAS